MKNKILAALIFMPMFAFAQDNKSNGLTYNYVGIGYGKVDLEDSGVKTKFNGVGVEAGALLSENIFITASYASASSDKITANGTSTSVDVDLTQSDVSLGYRHALAQGTDVTASVGVAHGKVKIARFGSTSDTVYPVGLGLRTAINETIQLGIEGSIANGDFSSSLNAQFKINSNVGVVGSYSRSDLTNGYLISLRYLY